MFEHDCSTRELVAPLVYPLALYGKENLLQCLEVYGQGQIINTVLQCQNLTSSLPHFRKVKQKNVSNKLNIKQWSALSMINLEGSPSSSTSTPEAQTLAS